MGKPKWQQVIDENSFNLNDLVNTNPANSSNSELMIICQYLAAQLVRTRKELYELKQIIGEPIDNEMTIKQLTTLLAGKKIIDNVSVTRYDEEGTPIEEQTIGGNSFSEIEEQADFQASCEHQFNHAVDDEIVCSKCGLAKPIKEV